MSPRPGSTWRKRLSCAWQRFPVQPDRLPGCLRHLCAVSGRWVEALTLWAALGVFMDRGSIADLPEDLRRRGKPGRRQRAR